MREIKFRAWDKETNKMYEVIEIDFYNEKVGYLFADPMTQGESVGYLKFSNIHLMQSTGVRNEKGAEIYEGDTIEYKTIYEWDKKPIKRAEVVFEDGMFGPTGVITDLSRSEIIGNIYEDPELLKSGGRVI